MGFYLLTISFPTLGWWDRQILYVGALILKTCSGRQSSKCRIRRHIDRRRERQLRSYCRRLGDQLTVGLDATDTSHQLSERASILGIFA